MKALALLSIFLALPVLAADQTCPQGCITTPKPLTCDQLRSRLVSRKCAQPDCKPAPCDQACGDCKPGPQGPKGDKGEPGATAIVSVPANIPQETATGKWLLGGGPVWQNKWGATVLAGYRRGEWTFLAGPVYLPHGAVDGAAVDGCLAVPFHVDAKQPWGGQAVVLYEF